MAPNFSNPTTMEDVLKLIRQRMDELFVLGEESERQVYWECKAINPDPRIEYWLKEIEQKIDQFFLDNR